MNNTDFSVLLFLRDYWPHILAFITPCALAIKFFIDRGDRNHEQLAREMIEERKRLSEDTAKMIDRLEREIIRLQEALERAESLNAQYLQELIHSRELISRLEQRLKANAKD